MTAKTLVKTCFLNKIEFSGSHDVVFVKNFHSCIKYYSRTEIGRSRMIFFSGYGQRVQTDGHDFGILIWKHVSTQKNLTPRGKL